MSEPTRLDWLKREHAEFLTKTSWPAEPNGYREDIGYLLSVVDLLEKQIEAQAIAHLDPDNQTPKCSCWHEIIDDAGSTIVGEYDPHCTVHRKEYADD